MIEVILGGFFGLSLEGEEEGSVKLVEGVYVFFSVYGDIGD